MSALWTAIASKLANTVEKPSKLMFIVLFISIFFIFDLTPILSQMGVTQTTPPIYAIISFLGAFAYFVYDFFQWIFIKIKGKIHKCKQRKADKRKREELIEYFDRLPEKRRNIIKRYYKNNRSVIALQKRGEHIFDFINIGLIVEIDGLIDESEPGFKIYHFKLNDLVREYIINTFQKDDLEELKHSNA